MRIPTLLKIDRFYGFLPSGLKDSQQRDIETCRICGHVARWNEVCSFCHDINKFPLSEMCHLAKAAWLHIETNESWLPSYEARLRIYYKYLEERDVQTNPI